MLQIFVTVDASDVAAYGVGGLLRAERGPAWVEFTTIPLVAGQTIIADEDGVDASTYRTRYSTAVPTVAGDYSDYSAARSVTSTRPWCSLDDFKTRMAGSSAYVPGTYDSAVSGVIIPGVSARLNREIGRSRGARGTFSVIADDTATARRFTGRPGPTHLLPIDDCVEVTEVRVDGQLLVAGVGFDVFPLNAETITGLIRLNGSWSGAYGGNSVSAMWGMFADLPDDLRDDAISESVSVYLSARAGHDDTIGMDAFGKVVTAKALLSKTYHDIKQYAHGGGALR